MINGLILLFALSVSCVTSVSPRGSSGAYSFYPPTGVYYFQQVVDHFTYDSTLTFPQKYLVYDKFHKPGGPIFFYFGNEGGIEDFYNNSGVMFEYAPQFSALLVFLEHRYYGTSQPFPHEENLRYLTIEQALADTTVFLSKKGTIFRNNCAGGRDSCKVILFGGSYGGMLVAWHRLKFPHMSVGALAASAPVDLYPGESKEKAFYDATINVFNKYAGDGTCGTHISSLIDTLSEFSYSYLTSAFRTCSPIKDSRSVEKLIFYIKGAFATLAMLDYPYPTTFVTPMPGKPVLVACNRFRKFGYNTLSGLNEAMNVFVNFTGSLKCHNISMEMVGGNSSMKSMIKSSAHLYVHSRNTSSDLGSIYRTWNYQTCTELILEPLTSDGNGFYVETSSQIKEVEATCKQRYGSMANTRPLWMLRSFGNGEDIVKHTTNIIFSDGDKDP